MEIIQSIIDFVMAHSVIILGALLGLSELLALIPGIKSNSIFLLIVNLLKKAAGKKDDSSILK